MTLHLGYGQAADEELMVLQSNKQKQLNDMDVLVTLGLEQVQAFSQAGADIPQDLSGVLVFSRSELARMSRRVEVRADITSTLPCITLCRSWCAAGRMMLHRQ